MGNKESGNINSTVEQGENSRKQFNRASSSTGNGKQRMNFFQHNPTQLAKDQQGRLDARWSQIVKKSEQKHRGKTQELVRKIAQQTKVIGEQCSKRFGQDETKLIQCFKLVAQPIWKIQKKGQQTIMGLGKTANKCLLRHNTQNQCIQQVRKQLHACLQDALKQMKNITLDFQ